MSSTNDPSELAASAKIFRILDVFVGVREPLTMSGISRATGLSTSTTHRLLQEMLQWGGLERTADGGYVVGIKLWEIAARANRSHVLKDVAMPYLQTLWESTKAHVMLTVMQDFEVLLLERIEGQYAVPVVGKVGGRLPLHAASAGKLLLALSEPAVQSEYLSQPMARYTPRTITQPEVLRVDLERIRKQGVAVSDGELAEGTYSCSAPIYGPPSLGMAAVTLLSLVGARDAQEMNTLVRSTARQITQALARAFPREIAPGA
ncbi:IclR family transcriptional regulator [Paeniglutamicibacter sp. ORCA_105]|uniref:IclR family transcriptional regulator n=1 Tax=Paeniglutamicibacter sp. ORCA_105 TaxID=3377336 RepID=UPI003895DFBE